MCLRRKDIADADENVARLRCAEIEPNNSNGSGEDEDSEEDDDDDECDYNHEPYN